jgi:hypothetical protein
MGVTEQDLKTRSSLFASISGQASQMRLVSILALLLGLCTIQSASNFFLPPPPPHTSRKGLLKQVPCSGHSLQTNGPTKSELCMLFLPICKLNMVPISLLISFEIFDLVSALEASEGKGTTFCTSRNRLVYFLGG